MAASFTDIIGQLMSPDNNVRVQAEAIFNESKKQPELLVSSLVQCFKAPQDEVRSLSAILLRRVLGRDAESLWPLLSAQTQETVKATLLQVVETEQSAPVRSNIAECIGHLGSMIIEKGGAWNDLLPFLFKCSKSESESHREASLTIFATLASWVGDKFRPYFDVLKGVLSSGLNDQSIRVRGAALTATSNFLQVLAEPNERAQFQQLTPFMLQTISGALNAANEEDARSALEVFVELAEIDPTFLRPNLAMVIGAMLSISSHTTLEDATKNLSVEFLVTLAESKPSMVRKYPKYLESVLPLVLNLMLDLEDEDWDKGTNEDDDDVDIRNSDIGEESLDRLALALGGKAMVPALFQLLPGMFANSDWRYRHTALISISIIGEGSAKVLQPNLSEIVKSILPFFRDPHPRVRWAACNTIGQMSTDFGPEFQTLFIADVLPALANSMDDKDNPRVQSHAASALINFAEHCTPELIAPYLEPLLGKLFALLQINKTIVQEQAVTAIAALADCAQATFFKYYDTIMPFLKNVLASANGKEYRMLRGKAMECISLIGIAVGKEKFLKDAQDVMQIMMRTQSSKLDPDDPQISFLLQSWARICRCLGADFIPYLPHVMPTLLNSAKISPDVTISGQEEDADAEGWDFISVGDKRIGIHTSGLEEKATACNMLYCYCSELKEGFFPYVEEVAKLMVPLMRFYYHDGVRSAATGTMPHLLTSALIYLKKSNAASGADTTYVRNLFNYMLPNFLDSLKEEVDPEILAASIGSFVESLAVAGEFLTAEQCQSAMNIVLELIDDVQERRTERAAKRKEEDHDEEEEERIEDEALKDDEIISGLGEIIGHLMKYSKANFLPIFIKDAMPVALEFLKPTSKTSDRQTALCIFDDVAEHGGAEVLALFPHFVPSMMAYTADEDPSVRQAALFGMGVIAQAGGEAISGAIPEILARLTAVITSPQARTEKYVISTENAIAAVGKICIYQSRVIDVAQVLPMWLSWLPVKEDNVESKVTYDQLLQFVESGNQYILGAGYANLPHILKIFAEILGTELINEEQAKRIVAILKKMQSSLPADLLGKSWGSLTPQHQQNLQKNLQ